jgi:SAM-dependent methyltransferase
MSPYPRRPATPFTCLNAPCAARGEPPCDHPDLGTASTASADSEASLQNGYYTHPAIVNLAGDVAGRRILDAGCGSGPIAVKPRDRGATVAGFDSSAAMLALARKRLGPDTDLWPAGLQGGKPDFFETRSWTDEWTFSGHSALKGASKGTSPLKSRRDSHEQIR